MIMQTEIQIFHSVKKKTISPPAHNGFQRVYLPKNSRANQECTVLASSQTDTSVAWRGGGCFMTFSEILVSRRASLSAVRNHETPWARIAPGDPVLNVAGWRGGGSAVRNHETPRVRIAPGDPVLNVAGDGVAGWRGGGVAGRGDTESRRSAQARQTADEIIYRVSVESRMPAVDHLPQAVGVLAQKCFGSIATRPPMGRVIQMLLAIEIWLGNMLFYIPYMTTGIRQELLTSISCLAMYSA